MKPARALSQIKLKRQLYDLFQNSRVNCNGWCCGWDAFNLSDHWIGRWCEFRDTKELHAAMLELREVESLLEYNDDDQRIEIVGFLRTGVDELRPVVDRITRMVNEILSLRSTSF